MRGQPFLTLSGLTRWEIGQFSCSFGIHFALSYSPIGNRRQEGSVIRPARIASFMAQAANQALAQASDGTLGAEPFRSSRSEARSAAQLTFAVCGLALSGRFFVELCSTV